MTEPTLIEMRKIKLLERILEELIKGNELNERMAGIFGGLGAK